ncbi:hypothetical protein [Roseibium sp. M-1]
MNSCLYKSLIGLVLAAGLHSTAFAYQKLLTYRIAGKDLLEVTEKAPEVEDPFTLTLKLATGGEPEELTIETDGDLGDCKDQLESIIGSDSAYAEIVVDESAQTMNGVMMTQCVVFHGLFGN